jgi:hypothetical protein
LSGAGSDSDTGTDLIKGGGDKDSDSDSTSTKLVVSPPKKTKGKKSKMSSKQSHKRTKMESSHFTSISGDHSEKNLPTPSKPGRHTHNAAFSSIAQSLESLVESLNDDHPAVPAVSANPVLNHEGEALNRAIELLEKEEALSANEKAIAIDIFISNISTASTFITISDGTLRLAWIRCRVLLEEGSSSTTKKKHIFTGQAPFTQPDPSSSFSLGENNFC